MFAGEPVAQPVPNSHERDVSLGLQGKSSQTNPDPGGAMGIPGVSLCMGCHRFVKTDSAHIKKLARFGEEKGEPVAEGVSDSVVHVL